MHKKNPFVKTMPHLGQIVKGVLNDQRISQARFSKLTGWPENTVSGMLNRRNWNGADLLLAGQVLKHNFVRYLEPEPQEATVSKTMFEEEVKEKKRLEAQVKELEEDLLEEKAKHKGTLEAIERMKK